ncbi:hypothetical protein EP164_12795 [Photorhabdus luminescens subsp. sonorensis]|uniref:Uncharacterized protein n=2 Tax=Photorhabdus luminescens TaxID=29488 RepID=A0A5C4RHA3_PHOLU|nr:hypothetical protein EP164_12795 [Photorhabdus luminescens subsp. sonorensis]
MEHRMFIMKNGISELEREKDQADINAEQQAIALLKIAMLSKKDIIEGRKMIPEEALRRRKERRA